MVVRKGVWLNFWSRFHLMMLRCQHQPFWLPNSFHSMLMFSSVYNSAKFLWLGINFFCLHSASPWILVKRGKTSLRMMLEKAFVIPFNFLIWIFTIFMILSRHSICHDLGIRRGSFCPMRLCVDQSKIGGTSLLCSVMGLVYQKWWVILGISDFASLIWDMWRKLGTRKTFSSVTYHFKNLYLNIKIYLNLLFKYKNISKV